MTAPGAVSLEHLNRLFVHAEATPLTNRYRVLVPDADGRPGDLLAVAEGERLTLRQEIRFFTDETRATGLFSWRSREIVDLHARTDIFDDAGTEIGWFERNLDVELARPVWTLHYAGVECRGHERSIATAIARRLVKVPIPFHIDFTDVRSGQRVLTVQRQLSAGRRYDVTLADAHLDERVAAAMGVAMDLFEGG